MSSLVFRQYRGQALVVSVLLAAFAALVGVTGLQMASQWHTALVTCAASHSCGSLSSTLFLGNHGVGFLVILTLGVPVVLGMLCGAPLVAHEFETGTNQFVWTQAVTRRRWLAVKAGWLLLAAAAVAGVVCGLVTWWSGPNNAQQANAFQTGRFDIGGNVQPSMVPASCHALMSQRNPGPVLSCMQSAGFRQFVSYQPANRYWAFQGIETGIYVGLALALLAITFALVRRQDA